MSENIKKANKFLDSFKIRQEELQRDFGYVRIVAVEESHIVRAELALEKPIIINSESETRKEALRTELCALPKHKAISQLNDEFEQLQLRMTEVAEVFCDLYVEDDNVNAAEICRLASSRFYIYVIGSSKWKQMRLAKTQKSLPSPSKGSGPRFVGSMSKLADISDRSKWETNPERKPPVDKVAKVAKAAKLSQDQLKAQCEALVARMEIKAPEAVKFLRGKFSAKAHDQLRQLVEIFKA